MPYLYITKSQFKKMINEYIEEQVTADEMNSLIIKFIKEYKKFDDCHFDNIKLLVDTYYNEYNSEPEEI